MESPSSQGAEEQREQHVSFATVDDKRETGGSGSGSGSGSGKDMSSSSSSQDTAPGLRRGDLGDSNLSSSSSSLSFQSFEPNKLKEQIEHGHRQQKQYRKTFLNSPTSYEDLLNQFGQLSQDLSKAVSTSQKLRDENDALIHHYDRLKEEHLKLRGKYVDVRRLAVEEAEGRILLEHRQDELVKRWQRQLEVKAKEFDELQMQLTPPRDIDLLRTKVQQELSSQHHAQLQSVESEVSKFRELYFRERNAHELRKTEFEQFTVDKRKEIETLRAAHTAECDELRSQIDLIRKEMEESSKQDQIRLRSLDVAAITAARDHLQDQLVTALKELEDLKIKCDKEGIENAERLSELRAENKELEVALSSVRKKEETSGLEIRRLQDLLEQSNAKVVQVQSDYSKLKSKLTATEKLVVEEQNRGAKQLSELSAKADRERHELRSAADSLERKLTLQDAKHAEQNKLRDDQHLAAVNEIERSKNRILQTLQETQSNRDNVTRELDEIKRTLELRTREHVETVDRLEASLESQVSLLRRATKEKEALHSKTKALADRLKQVQQRADQYQDQGNELEKEYRLLQEKHRDLLSREQTLRGRVEKLQTTKSLLEQDLERLENEKLRLRTLLDEANAQVDVVRSESIEKENTMQQKMAETIVLKTKQDRRQVEKLEKKKKTYNTALEKCKTRIKDLVAKNQGLQQELKTQSNLHRTELDSLQRRLRELERERELQSREFSSSQTRFLAETGTTAGSFPVGASSDFDL